MFNLDKKEKTKIVTCSYKGCSNRRPHFESLEVTRKPITFEVPEELSGPFYCSVECMLYSKAEEKNEN